MIILIVVLIIFLIFFIKYQRSKKKIVVQQVNVVTGAPKTCKSLLTLYLARKDYKKRLFRTKLYNFFHSAKKQKELPLFYSTIPVKFPHVILTEEMLLRKVRFRYNSVIFVDEAYLVADSESFKDSEVNESLSLFNKLIGHELRGGSVFYNSQNIHDLHFAIKRVATNYIYIDSKRGFPFFMNIHCRELVNSDEVSLTNVTYDDPKHDPSFRRLLIPKRYFKLYDCYCYSKLTDNLPIGEEIVDYKKLPDLKTSYVCNIKHGANAKGGVKNVRKNTRKSTTTKK